MDGAVFHEVHQRGVALFGAGNLFDAAHVAGIKGGVLGGFVDTAVLEVAACGSQVVILHAENSPVLAICHSVISGSTLNAVNDEFLAVGATCIFSPRNSGREGKTEGKRER